MFNKIVLTWKENFSFYLLYFTVFKRLMCKYYSVPIYVYFYRKENSKFKLTTIMDNLSEHSQQVRLSSDGQNGIQTHLVPTNEPNTQTFQV